MATAAIAALAPSVMDAIMGGGGKSAAPIAPVSGLTQEQLIQAINDYNKYTTGMESLYGTPTTVGGVGVTQASQVSGQEQKKKAFIQMRMSMGDSLEAATQKANKRAASGQGFDTENFRNYVSSGNAPGLSIGANGGIKAAPQFTGGGVQTPGISQGLTDAMKQLSLQSVLSAGNLPQMFGQQAQNALGFQDQARNQYSQMLGEMGPEGLSAADLANLEAYKQAQLQDLGSINKQNIAGVVGDLTNRGFMSSNLAEQALQRGVYDPQAKFLTALGGNLATMQNDFLNSAASRKAQAFGNIAGGVSSVGNPASISSILQGVTDPSSAGLFDDVNAAYLASQLQQQNINNRRQDQQFGSALQTQPTLQIPQGGVNNPMMQGLAGMFGAPIASAVGGLANKAGSAVGGAITNLGNKAGKGVKDVYGRVIN